MRRMVSITLLVAVLLSVSVISAGENLSVLAAPGSRIVPAQRVYTRSFRTADSPSRCAALLKADPQLAHNPQGCNIVVVERVIIKQAKPVSNPEVVVGGGGCTPYNPDADIEIDQSAYGSWQWYEIEQDTEFLGNGCSTPGFGIHHCYANYSVPGFSVSTSWCDTSTDANWDASGHAGFWISPAFGGGYTAKIDTTMPYWMDNWWDSCSPMNCN